ncbi:DUF3606 domain-containing protein [Magnetospirillum sp. 15-1]|uniref:DUF3606 domain-containing protein n=1 Tax=Magnetospirillum sp. 15-1 TaxID=1979370 RepID=UPI000BBB7979|nr:DUF3606 domain-containing protein [Magnetospirillum sp. 15-1]
MSDNLKITHPQDAKRINMNQPHEVQHWCAKFRVTRETLEAAIRAAKSDYADAVERVLNNKRP